MEDASKSQLLSHAAKYGAILGLIHFIIFIVLYIVDPTLVVGLIYLAIVLLLNFIYPSIMGVKYRKEEAGGYLSFGNSFLYGFGVLLTSGLLSLILNILISSLVLTEMPGVLAEAQVENSVEMARMFGAPDDALEKMENDMDVDKLRSQFSALGQIKNFWLPVIFYAIGGLILGLIIRKQEPIDDI